MKMNCIIIDDEPFARKILEDYASDVDFLSIVGSVENPIKASEILANHSVNLMFLDIHTPKISGIEFLRTSPSLPLTIIASAYSDFAVDGFDLNVVDYLVKPFSFERFLKACTRARDLFMLQKPAQKTQAYFFVKHNSKLEKVWYDQLLYVEGMSNYVVLHTPEKKLIVYLTMKGIEQELPREHFLRVHKSFIVNRNKVESIEGNGLSISGNLVPVSASLNEEVTNEIVNGRLLKR
jgi:DNA-binding LytR/AlgR family response regulator